MPTLTTPDRACRGLRVDGTDYDVDAKGRIEVERADHARSIRRHFGEASRIVIGFAAAAGHNCRECSFAMFKWQQRCPRCGTES